eukprot:4575633-Pyramimonas_sp.AAC.1
MHRRRIANASAMRRDSHTPIYPNPIREASANGVVTTTCGESVRTRGHCTALGLGIGAVLRGRATGASEVPQIVR